MTFRKKNNFEIIRFRKICWGTVSKQRWELAVCAVNGAGSGRR